MSVVAAIRQMLAAGLSVDQALTAAEVFEAGHPTGRPRAQQSDRVWVYVIAVDHPGDALVKVGISQHPTMRKATLERERGYNLYIAHTEGPFSRAEALAIERRAHDALKTDRETGEWFYCGVERATEVVLASASAVPR